MIKKTPVQPYERVNHAYDKSVYRKGRRNKSPVIAVLILVAVWYLFIGKDLLSQLALQNNDNSSTQEKVYYDFPCSEANLARLIGATLGDPIDDTTEEEALWYEKYYQQIEAMGITSLKRENAFNLLSSDQLKKVFSELTSTNVEVEDKKSLQLYEVLEFYENVLNEKGKAMEYKTLSILETPASNPELLAWHAATSEGIFDFEGLVIEPLKDKRIQVACMQEQLLGIVAIESDTSNLEDCKIIEVEDGTAQFEIAGMTITYENKALHSEDIGKVGCITIKDGKITAFSTTSNQQVDTLVSISKDTIILEKAGSLGYNGISIDDQTGKNAYKTVSDLTYGLKVAYSQQGGQITRLQVVGESPLEEIRVVLNNHQQGYMQEEVSITPNSDYDIVYDGKANTLSSKETWQASKFGWVADADIIRFIPRSEGSRLKINSLSEDEKVPSYPGVIEVRKIEDGYILINEVDLEDYVAGVLPNEMPDSYGLEALKAQAIAIRTYGASGMAQSRFMDYGAHVDDTTATQVYRPIEEDEIVNKAVSETAGMVLKSDGRLISNKFFAASCGYTANFGEVWAGGKNFPSDTPSYLVSRQQYAGDKLVSNLQTEEGFKCFINLDGDDMDAFDEESPWFRWNVQLSSKELENLIKPALKTLSDSYGALITYTSKAGIQEEKPVETLGAICDMEVLERGQGGNIMSLRLQFEKANVTVSTEYLIRRLFASNETQGLSVERSNKTTVNEMTLLPSAFFTIEEAKNQSGLLQSVTLIGGGNGHGVGLSQDGAKGMAERGYAYDQILEHYYKDCEIVELNGK